jgi:hypothetical protein
MQAATARGYGSAGFGREDAEEVERVERRRQREEERAASQEETR